MTAGRVGIGWVGLLLLASVAAVVAFIGFEFGRSRAAERRAFPQWQGALSVAGARLPIDLLRDAQGVPHVFAENEADAWFGLGFAQAQDRLAQMLWLVRLARGTTAEIVGPEGLEADRHARTLGLGRTADAEAAALRGGTRELLEAYAAGVNARMARIETGAAAAPVAVAALELPLVAWTPADSLAILKLHAWSLSNSVAASLVLQDLLSKFGGVDARAFFPDKPGVLPAVREPALTAGIWRDPLRRALGLAGTSAGSTAWIVSGAHTESGRPLLGADVHVEPTAPALLHVAHVRGGEIDVAGVLIPGLPLFWTGRNAAVAWGSTHARAVVTDLYSERVDEASARYHDGGRWRKLDVRSETIAVRGFEPETHPVRATRHGPLLDGLVGEREPLALAWVGLRGQGGRTVAAFRAAVRAGDAAELRAALAGVSEPALAVAYIDAQGAGGVQVVGWIPERPLDTELVPVPGRARWFDWGGAIPHAKLPGAELGAGQAFLIAADNPQPSRGVARGEWLWRSGARAARLEQGLRRALMREPLGLGNAEALQADVLEPRGRALSRAALALLGDDALGREASEVRALLAAWDGRADAESSGAAAHHTFVLALSRRLFEERMGAELFARWRGLSQVDHVGVVSVVLARASKGGGDVWSDPQHVRAAVRDSLRDAWFQLSSRLGASRRKWSWGRLQELRFRAFVPSDVVSPLTVDAIGGSGESVAVSEFAPDAPFEVRLSALFRFAAEPGDEGGARFQLAPGLTEHPGHPSFSAGLAGWSAGRGTSLEMRREALDAAGSPRLALEPAP
ncbi:MAG: penicillin acylase family protein [Deltaproteobacteria bacterium]|nr:penicillin acylase family protein [Deltaproteobacteria bacterium]